MSVLFIYTQGPLLSNIEFLDDSSKITGMNNHIRKYVWIFIFIYLSNVLVEFF